MSGKLWLISGMVWIIFSVVGGMAAEATATQTGENPNVEKNEKNSVVTCRIQIYPETIQYGDTISVLVTQYHSGDRPVQVFSLHSSTTCDNMITLRIRNTRRGEEFGLYEEEILREVSHERSQFHRLQPGEEAIVFATKYTVPPLEEWSSDFWKHVEEDITESDNPFIETDLDIRLKFQTLPVPYRSHNGECHEVHQIFPLRISLRSPDEMERIRLWYSATPREFFPEVKSDREDAFAGSAGYRWPRKFARPETDDHLVRIGEKTFSPWCFIQTGNRYPSDPNCPETWQGWKTLEESLTPSTMRDEIRLTRMIIQYCDTEDPEVLNELTEWLTEMNEIQRCVMTENIRKIPGNFHSNSEIQPIMATFVKTMQDFDRVETPPEE